MVFKWGIYLFVIFPSIMGGGEAGYGMVGGVVGKCAASPPPLCPPLSLSEITFGSRETRHDSFFFVLLTETPSLSATRSTFNTNYVSYYYLIGYDMANT